MKRKDRLIKEATEEIILKAHKQHCSFSERQEKYLRKAVRAGWDLHNLETLGETFPKPVTPTAQELEEKKTVQGAFWEFLKEKGAEEDFEKEFRLYRAQDAKKYLRRNDYHHNTFLEAFVWSKTKQGWQFWAILDREWRRLYYDKYSN